MTTTSRASTAAALDTQRVDLQGLQLVAEGEGEVADPRHHPGDRADVGGGPTADAVQDGRGAQAAQQLFRALRRHRQRSERGVVEHLDEDAAEGDGEDRAPLGVADDADEQFEATGAHR